jgi:hypothetical protein
VRSTADVVLQIRAAISEHRSITYIYTRTSPVALVHASPCHAMPFRCQTKAMSSVFFQSALVFSPVDVHRGRGVACILNARAPCSSSVLFTVRLGDCLLTGIQSQFNTSLSLPYELNQHTISHSKSKDALTVLNKNLCAVFSHYWCLFH